MCLAVLFLIVLHLSAPTGASEGSIIGGTIARRHSRPYMASLQNNGHVCGGVLIRDDFVLTSGHCIKSYPLLVVLGAQNLSKEEESQQKISVAFHHRHPFFQNSSQTQYDVMLLKLNKNATLNEYVKVIQLPKKTEKVHESSKCSVAGWGMTQHKSTTSDALREANVTVMNIRTCKRMWQKYFDVKQMLCSQTKDGKGICQGDSGGPLVCENKAYGIAAYTYPTDCANRQYPNVYMNISFFMPWIEEVLVGAVS